MGTLGKIPCEGCGDYVFPDGADGDWCGSCRESRHTIRKHREHKRRLVEALTEENLGKVREILAAVLKEW
jgi:hypothetical protein